MILVPVCYYVENFAGGTGFCYGFADFADWGILRRVFTKAVYVVKVFVVQSKQPHKHLEVMNSYVPERTLRGSTSFTGEGEEIFIAQNKMRQVILPDVSRGVIVPECVGDKLMKQYMNFENVITAESCTQSNYHAVSRGFIGKQHTQNIIPPVMS